MVTLADVAKEAGVSPMTVSYALRDKAEVSAETRARVKQIADRLGYRVNVTAQNLRRGRAGAITLTVPELQAPFHAQLATHVMEAARRQDLRVVVETTYYDRDRELAAIRGVRSGVTDGLIMFVADLSVDALKRESRGVPMVTIDPIVEIPGVDCVLSPDRAGAQAAGRHLAQIGCGRIVAVGVEGQDAPHRQSAPPTSDLRMAGVQEGVSSVNPGLPPVVGVPADWSVRGARDAMLHAIDQGLVFDGIFAMTDSMALGVIRALADRGIRCPADVKVIGFDGIADSSYWVPSLSTIAMDLADMASTAIDLVQARIKSGKDAGSAQRVVGEFSLIQRESTSYSTALN